MASRVSRRDVRAWSPFFVLAVAVAVFAWALVVYSIEAPTAPVLSRIYAALDMFTGAYIPLDQSATPSATIAFAGILSLLVTFLAAFAALYALSTKAREWLRARRARFDLIVIGSGDAAADILRAQPTHTSSDLLLITGEDAGPAAITAAGIALRIVADLDALATNATLLELTRRAARVAVATDDDGLNLWIADAITTQAESGQKVMALIADPTLADERRPSIIDGVLPDRFGLSCPAENIAEAVCHQLDLRVFAHDVIQGADGLAICLDLDDSDLAETVALWVRRYVWSRGYLLSEASQKRLPRLEVVDLRQDCVVTDPTILHLARVLVVAAEDPGVSASKTLLALRNDRADSSTGLVSYVTVTTSYLIGESVVESSRISVVDPKTSAWDNDLIFDDIVDQWGRAFNEAYNVIYGKNLTWTEVRHKREGQSSRLAAQHMLSVLKQHGYQLVKTVGHAMPVDPGFSDEQARAMAELEHEDWLVRKYKQNGAPTSVATGRDLADIHWTDLSEADKDRNLRLIRHTYPGMAALFGYEIQLSPTDTPSATSRA